MKFDQFRKLIDRRQNLLKTLETTEKENEKQTLKNEISQIERQITTEDINTKLTSMLEIDTDKFTTQLVKYFEDKDQVIRLYADKYISLCLGINNNFYELGYIDYNIDLTCLYSIGYRKDWDKLFADNPDLKDYIWNYIKDCVINNNKHRISLIQQMIEEGKKEQDFLRSPNAIRKRLGQIAQERDLMTKEIEEITSNIDEV